VEVKTEKKLQNKTTTDKQRKLKGDKTKLTKTQTALQAN